MPSALRLKTHPYVILAIICTGIFIASLDQTVIYGVMPDIMPDIRLSVFELDQAAWIVNGYLLGFTVAMPLMGRISDVYGHGRIFVLSLLLFLVGSVFVAISPSLEWMVGARIFQAIGGGAMVPIAMAIVADVFPSKNRVIALGVIGGVVEGGAALGPLYGGLFADYLDWRWIFWINIPISIVVIALVVFLLGPGSKSAGKIDYIGGILLAGSLALLSIALCHEWGQPDSVAHTISYLVPAIALFGLFILREIKSAEPLIEFSMFKNVTFSSAGITNLFVGGALIMALVNVPLMSDTILGCSPLEGGLRLLRLTAMISIGAVIGGFICKRFGYRLPTILGLILSAVGFVLLSSWTLDISDPAMTLHLIICGFGFGLVVAPLAAAAVDSVREDQRGIGSSLAVMMRMLGMIIGLSALTSWGMGDFHGMTEGMLIEELLEYPEELVDSVVTLFHNFFIVSVGICLAAIVPALWLRKKKRLP